MNLYPTTHHWTNSKITFRNRESHHFDWVRVYLRPRLGFVEGARDETLLRCEHKSHSACIEILIARVIIRG
jgi:hypothetical protein